jgi:hypothetical protein
MNVCKCICPVFMVNFHGTPANCVHGPCVCVCMRVCISVCVFAYARMCVCNIHMYTHTHMYTHEVKYVQALYVLRIFMLLTKCGFYVCMDVCMYVCI